MAITVKEIHEKEFSRQVRGYNIDEVDDFLDAIANQLEMLIRENRALAQQLEAKGHEAVAVPEAPKPPVVAPAPVITAPVITPVISPAPSPAPTVAPVDEPSYFKNLEATLRETLISAQRIADDTVLDARKKANQMVANAEEQANAILASSKVEAESVRAQNVEIRKAAEDYRARFLRLVEDQMHVLKADGSLFE